MANVRVIATDLEFPEGPVVMPDGSVVLVEIRGKRLTRVWPDGRKEVVAEILGGPNGAALGPDGKMYVCNNGGFSWIPTRNTFMPGPPSAAEYIGGSIQRVDLATGKVETVIDRVGEHPLKGPNDLVFDKHGGLWFTDLGKRRARDMDVGAFYYIKPGMKEIVEGAFGMMPANGIGLSPDENTVYVAETPTARLWAFDLAAPGEVKPRDPIYRGERGKPIAGLGGYQMFDSLAVEASGNVCVATLISGCISVIAPDGKIVEQVETGDRMTTNIAFGGPDLKTAYITLSGRGELVAMDWARPGLALNFLNK
ncbi:SMP-30/gluconolactonase/LRE family protein [Bradyrhizobium sp. KBS0727]|uniref:SMP-30/gluconolactonase/LRE family protein n=1 Tax=unclassified Bradyrhizobium TaxID=2631580 RepID=UPI00110D2F29|nr:MULTISPECIES: SMP-30/gluconolactonase/LRE family protein [unclassified Bradyrhizobium]QDW40395.1 SMP-30/gluconolactonase/LRE family protein [Bradyrhizobium sp. KBS0725]QDW46999.1 SMP-30/gluconolactonase/LRE family protein [Bradyrhizobium sp. KBS0727]